MLCLGQKHQPALQPPQDSLLEIGTCIMTYAECIVSYCIQKILQFSWQHQSHFVLKVCQTKASNLLGKLDHALEENTELRYVPTAILCTDQGSVPYTQDTRVVYGVKTWCSPELLLCPLNHADQRFRVPRRSWWPASTRWTLTGLSRYVPFVFQ